MRTLLAAILTALTWLPAAAQVRVRLATLAPKGSSFHQILLAMGEKWRRAPGGGVALTIYTDGTMGSEADVVRRMRIGQLQAGMLTTGGLSEIDKAVTALQYMPMMFRSLEEVDYVEEKLQPDLERRLLDKGFVVLFWGDAGWVRYFCREPVVRPADLKKLKVFVGAGDNEQLEIVRAAGYRPVPLETNDMLTGLQTGMIDAVPTIPVHALASQIYTVARHMLELNWAPLVGATVLTRKAWEALSPETRTAVMQAAREAGQQIKARSRAESEEAVRAMQKRGLTVHRVPLDAEAEWRKLAESLYPQIRGRMVPADMFDKVRQLLEEHRAARKSVK
ncbi:MAG: TRAP transporter substrate-binding protein DctP [Bryobacterales bacterium]|nr:TRAP transporter substrate-binding protein DctP [Bryobacteraceae bacterium]MDW8354223.1 TRAP transporter substrate-binding protein DctP [Bryobacterales bacterium]